MRTRKAIKVLKDKINMAKANGLDSSIYKKQNEVNKHFWAGFEYAIEVLEKNK